uniref:Uncharacterized protein n=1 Tax=Anguilla anguilla TaxID=7936 RepID=A0A0E9QMW7_ANGAN
MLKADRVRKAIKVKYYKAPQMTHNPVG